MVFQSKIGLNIKKRVTWLLNKNSMSPSYHRSIAVNMKKNEICLILTNFQGIFDGKAGLNIKNGENGCNVVNMKKERFT